jgi:hypothetical protein
MGMLAAVPQLSIHEAPERIATQVACAGFPDKAAAARQAVRPTMPHSRCGSKPANIVGLLPSILAPPHPVNSDAAKNKALTRRFAVNARAETRNLVAATIGICKVFNNAGQFRLNSLRSWDNDLIAAEVWR